MEAEEGHIQKHFKNQIKLSKLNFKTKNIFQNQIKVSKLTFKTKLKFQNQKYFSKLNHGFFPNIYFLNKTTVNK